MIIPEGTLLAIEQGEYSDYGVMGFFRVIRAFDGMAVLAVFLEDHPKMKVDYYFEEDEFLAHLSKSGFIEDVDYMSWHLGSYSCVKSVKDPA